jgi:hypothetical protein
MTWVRHDDGAPLHPKLIGLSDGAFRLWYNAMAFANRAVTDGKIPSAIVVTLDHARAWTKRQIAAFVVELVAAGTWLEVSDGYLIHDYAEYQEEALKSSVESRRSAARDRKRRQRSREKDDRTGASHAVTGRDGARDSMRDARPDTGASGGGDAGPPVTGPRPDPSRPVPTTSLHSVGVREDIAPPVAYDRLLGVPAPDDPRGRPLTPPAPPEGEQVDLGTASRIVGLFETAWRAATGRTLGLGTQSERQRATELYRKAIAEGPDDPFGLIRRATEAACADEEFRKMRGPWAAFVTQPWRNLVGEGQKPADELLEAQRAAQAAYDRAISDSRAEDAAKAKAEVERIAGERRRRAAQQAQGAERRGGGPRRAHV